MTTREVAALAELSARLTGIEARLKKQGFQLDLIERELSETRGALKLGRFVLGFLGMGGLAAFLASMLDKR